MIVLNHEQGSPEWYEARRGLPTASNFDKIITSKGEPSKQRTKYLYQLAGEIVSGVVEETYQNGAMQRGKSLEGEARDFYRLITDSSVSEVGLCVRKKPSCGASPDGLVEEDGGFEAKCPNMTTHVGYLLDGELPVEYFQQVHGNLFVTGRKWWDFMSYYPGIRPLLIRVEPDQEFIEALENELKSFCQELNDLVKKIKEGK